MSAFEYGLPPPVPSRPPPSQCSLPPLAVQFPLIQGVIKANPTVNPFGYITFEMIAFAVRTVFAMEQSDGRGCSQAAHDTRLRICFAALAVKYRPLGLSDVGWERVFPYMRGNFEARLKEIRHFASPHNCTRVPSLDLPPILEENIDASLEASKTDSPPSRP